MHHGIHHFHGTPVWGSAGDVHRIAVSGAGAFVSYVRPDQIAASIQHAQVVGIDNGAFSAWVRGLKINWSDFYKWLLNYYHHPKVAFFVIPDVVDGGERDNDALINEVPKMFYGKATPVWHLHESIDRLIELCREWPRVCFGSSGEYAAIRTAHWHRRMQDAFEAIYCRHNFKTAVHGLRMLDGRVLGNYPLATADSTNLACNVPKFNSKYPELTRAIQEAEYSRNLTEKELKAVILKNRCAILKGAIEAVRPPSVSDWLSNGLQPSRSNWRLRNELQLFLNAEKKAINPYVETEEQSSVSALSNLIALYAADNEQEQLRREALSDQVWERYFFNESRDPVQREMEQDKLISRAKLAHEQQRFNPDMVILADVNAQPSHISKPLMQRIEYFSSLGRPKAYSRYLRETIKPCLERLEHVRDCQLSTSFRFMASHEGLDGLLILPEMSQDQVKRLSTLVAAHMSMCLDAACGDLYVTDDVKPEEIRKTWKRWQRKPCIWMSSRLRLSNSAGKETAVNPCPMNSFRVRWRVCCALTGGTGNYGRCVANGGKSSCVLSAWSAKKHLPMSAMKP